MRTFIALLFNEEFKKELTRIQSKLRTIEPACNYTSIDNLHLTLAFLGEYDRKMQYQACLAMDEVKCTPFNMHLGRAGRFGRDKDGILWVQAQPARKLQQLKAELDDALIKRGLPFDKKPFKPHITVARRCGVGADIIDVDANVQQRVEKISLMRSERIAGKLVYTEIYSKKL